MAFRQSRLTNTSFAYVGIAVDPDTQGGNEFVARFGPFDQTIVGGGWSNLGAAEFIWGSQGGRAIIPQVLVVERLINVDSSGVAVGPAAIIRRILGVDSIVAFSKSFDPERAKVIGQSVPQ